jgi:hypothetical protein
MKQQNWRDTVLALCCGLGCLAIAAAVAVVGPAFLFAMLLWMGAERTVYSRLPSPDGWHEARVQFDDCGAPCGWAKIVYVRGRWLPLDSPFFSCRAFVGDGTDRVRLEWKANERLVIHHGFNQRGSFESAKACGSIVVMTRFDPSLISPEP